MESFVKDNLLELRETLWNNKFGVTHEGVSMFGSAYSPQNDNGFGGKRNEFVALFLLNLVWLWCMRRRNCCNFCSSSLLLAFPICLITCAGVVSLQWTEWRAARSTLPASPSTANSPGELISCVCSCA